MLGSIRPVRSTSWCHIWSKVVSVYQRTTNCEYCQSLGSSALLILQVYHFVQTNEYAAVHAYRQLLLYNYIDNQAGPIAAPHMTRFVDRSDELLNSKNDRSATGAERPIQIPSIPGMHQVRKNMDNTSENKLSPFVRPLLLFRKKTSPDIPPSYIRKTLATSPSLQRLNSRKMRASWCPFCLSAKTYFRRHRKKHR